MDINYKNTRAYHYNQAKKEIENSQLVTFHSVKQMIMTPNTLDRGTVAYTQKEKEIEMSIGNKHGLYMVEVLDIYSLMETEGEYPYLDKVAGRLLQLIGIEEDKQTLEQLERAKHVCYYTSRYKRAMETIAKYNHYFEQGFIHFHDITEEMDSKKAILKGTQENDFITVKKEEKVKLVHKGGQIGYQTPRQRTKLYIPSVDCDLFIKLID